mmetsp:Transcript_15537/g.39448  ORF Transcript_15537/g.39448 Transcript_15537/m.39448 type:complete len:191 (+) Transcript_15537:7-579(+)
MTSMSLHGNKGGRKSKKTHVPSESEGFALTVGCAMHWAFRRSSANPMFFSNVAKEVKDAEATEQNWDHAEVVDLFHEKVLCGVGQKALTRYLQKSYARKTVSHDEWAQEFVGSVIYRFLATADAGNVQGGDEAGAQSEARRGAAVQAHRRQPRLAAGVLHRGSGVGGVRRAGRAAGGIGQVDDDSRLRCE